MGELERLGQSDVWGETLLWVLRRAGWTVIVRPALGGGHLVIARMGRIEVCHIAATLVDAAKPVFDAAARSGRLAVTGG